MTLSNDAKPSRLRPPPFGLRLAAILCAALGFYKLLSTLAPTAQLLERHIGSPVALLADPIGALLVLTAGILLWLRQPVGIGLLVVGVVLAPATHRLLGGPVRPPSLLLLAPAVLLAANLKHLRRAQARSHRAPAA